MPALPSPASRRGAVIPLALVVAGAAFLAGGPSGPTSGVAVDRYQAGQPAIVRSVLPAGDAARVRERGLDRARLLGVPAGTRTQTSRVVDRFSGSVLDEVVTLDVRGNRLGIVRMRPDGRVAAAMRLGWYAGGGPIDAATAASRASSLAAAARITVRGTPIVGRTADAGWRVSWPRAVAGTPVLGDGASVTLFADGTFHAAATEERDLAPAPAVTLAAVAAQGIAAERLRTLLGPTDAASATIVATRLAWVAPNDTFDASAPDAPDPVLRLAWVAQVRTRGTLADRVRALELYLDAGTGTLIGGDLLR